MRLVASLVILADDGEEPVTETVGISGDDPFYIGQCLVKWMRERADELEKAMEADRD